MVTLKEMWVPKSGIPIPINVMPTKHIENAIAKIINLHSMGTPWRTEFLEPLQKEVQRRQSVGDYYTGATRDETPFSLGIEGEVWEDRLPGLRVVVDGNFTVYATRHSVKSLPWALFYGQGDLAQKDRQWRYFSDLILMVAAIHSRQGLPVW